MARLLRVFENPDEVAFPSALSQRDSFGVTISPSPGPGGFGLRSAGGRRSSGRLGATAARPPA